jgi:hypothetical protein
MTLPPVKLSRNELVESGEQLLMSAFERMDGEGWFVDCDSKERQVISRGCRPLREVPVYGLERIPAISLRHPSPFMAARPHARRMKFEARKRMHQPTFAAAGPDSW